MKNISVKELLSSVAGCLNLGDISYIDDNKTEQYTSTGNYLLNIANLCSEEIATEYNWNELSDVFSSPGLKMTSSNLFINKATLDASLFRNIIYNILYISVQDKSSGTYSEWKSIRQATREEQLLELTEIGQYIYTLGREGLFIYPYTSDTLKIKFIFNKSPIQLKTFTDTVVFDSFLVKSRMICYWKMNHGENYEDEYKTYRKALESIISDERNVGKI